jgi:ParE toxin of type II toxin-antitoxin system, parDE
VCLEEVSAQLVVVLGSSKSGLGGTAASRGHLCLPAGVQHGPLAENPHRVGKPLLEPLAPQYSARRGEYRVLYLIEDEQVTIIITAATHRADAYRTR